MLPHSNPSPLSIGETAEADSLLRDRRVTRRMRTLKQGKIVLSDWTVIDCLIRDMSDQGARLALGGLIELPNTFRLLVISSNLLFPAELEWRRSLLAGVRFTGPARPAPPRIF